MRDRSLDSLHPIFKPLVYQFLARLVEANIPVLITNTRRTAAEHAEDVKNGRSWTAHSKHEDGLAIDICPYNIYQLYGLDKLQWQVDDPVWQRIGAIGERVGLKWGGRWTQRDLSHFEAPTNPRTAQSPPLVST